LRGRRAGHPRSPKIENAKMQGIRFK